MIGGDLKNILSENEFAFVKNYNALTTLKLKPLEYLILNEILSFNINGMEYTGSFNYFCRKYNVTNKTAIKALKSLTDKEYITKQASKGGKTSIYKINEEKLIPVFLNTKETLGLNNANSGEITQLDNANSGEITQLDNANSGEITQLQWRNYTVNSGETPHNKNIYKNNNKNTTTSGGSSILDPDPNEKTESELREICNLYKREISNKTDCSPVEADTLKGLIQEYGADKVKEAIETAVKMNKKFLNYITGVLNNKKAADESQQQQKDRYTFSEPAKQTTPEQKAKVIKMLREFRLTHSP